MIDPRESSRRQSQPRGFDAAGSGKVRFATDHVTVVPMPTLEEMGPHLAKEVFYSQSAFDRMMTERKKLKRRAARLAKSPAHARRKSQPKTRKDEKIFPDGQNSVNVAGLGAEEHLAAIHADQFHRLLRADSFDDFQDM